MPEGIGSAPGPSVVFGLGSASTVMVTVVGVFVLSMVFTAPFHMPDTKLGYCGMPAYCQSPHVPSLGERHAVGPLAVRSVMKTAGKNGRPEPSRAALSPVVRV